MAFLLDTNVVSELRRASPHPHVLAWLRRHSRGDAFISTLVVGEIERGIERIRPRDAARAENLADWLSIVVDTYGDRILPVSLAVAREWGRLSGTPQPPPVVDGLMAATALVHRLTLVTRNVADVARTGVPVVNPFEDAGR